MLPPSQLSGWRQQLAAYRVIIIIVAVLMVGAGALVLIGRQRNSPYDAATTNSLPEEETRSDGGLAKSLQLKASDDTAIMETELQDVDIDAYLEAELQALEQDINQL